MFLDAKNLKINETNEDLIREFMSREDPIEKIAIPCSLTLPEMYSDVNNLTGVAVGVVTGKEHNFTNTQRRQVKVNTKAVIVPNGLVFKGALNKTEDLRIRWEDIDSCKIKVSNKLGMFADIYVGAVQYPLFFTKAKLGELFIDYVSHHMLGNADDGWS